MNQYLDGLDRAGIDETMRYLEKRRRQLLGRNASEKMLGPNPFVGITRRGILETAGLSTWQMVKNPRNVLRHGFRFTKELGKAARGRSEIEPEPRDRRFADTSWKLNPFYRGWMQIYLAAQKELDNWIEDENLTEYDKKRIQFLAALILDSIAPSNSALNPAALKRFIETGGLSAVQGARHLVADLVSHFGMPSSVDKRPFKVGKNLAASPGSVVFRNDVLELIQYQSATKEVFSRPLLLVPPQINKFYVFDLSERNSIVRYLTQNGLQMFVVSWKNPTPKERHWNMDTYIGALEDALEAMTSITSSKDFNLMAACSGGVTLVSMLGYYAAKQLSSARSATLLVSLYDMESTTETPMTLFADKKSIERARKYSASKGVLDGGRMARLFAWMRPNDLIWNYWVNNYLLGNPPPAFDILYWNADTTCLPAEFHGEMLGLFENNALVKPDEMTVKGTPIDLGRIECDTYTVAGVTDHICPWRACFRSSRHLGGKKEFVLSTSGHIQSILNLPGNPKASYQINPGSTEKDPDAWQAGATKEKGSWWENWVQWIGERSGDMIEAPRKLGNKDYQPKSDAPGSYVFE
jgi:polyhydroxyalkanoate synthase